MCKCVFEDKSILRSTIYFLGTALYQVLFFFSTGLLASHSRESRELRSLMSHVRKMYGKASQIFAIVIRKYVINTC